MPTVSELIRKHLFEEIVGMREPWPRVPDVPVLHEWRWCERFERLMRNRLVMGAFRYQCEDFRRGVKLSYDNVRSIRDRLRRYDETGDLEIMVDVANLAMMEFMTSKHPLKHFGNGGDHKDHAGPSKLPQRPTDDETPLSMAVCSARWLVSTGNLNRSGL